MTDIAKSEYVTTTKIINLLKLVAIEKPKALPKVLSIDEFKGNAGGKKFQCILTDPKNKKIVDILPGRESHVITDYFKGFNNRNNVEFFIMDMSRAYLDIAKSYFPNAKIIIDRFHVARYNTWAFDNVRRRIQSPLLPENRKYFKRSRKLLLARMSSLSENEKQKVNVMLSFSNDLAKAYLLKEKFYEFMDSKSSDAAKEKLKAFFLFAHVQELREYDRCVTMLRNWHVYIFNSFDYPYSNGFTEGINNKIKVIKRIAFGFRNFDILRKRVLLTE